MARRTTYSAGTPCWVDLSTPDPEAAARFYGAVFGWTVRDQPGGRYSFFERDGEVVAGLAPLSEAQAAAGTPPSWSLYVRSDDVAADAARAQELGGSVPAEPLDVPEAGRMAVVVDPQGASLILWSPAPFQGAPLVNDIGAWAWNDVLTPDPAAAAPFYEALFGWEIAEAPGSGGQYWPIRHEGRGIGGLMQAPPGVDRPAWMTYIGVESAGAALEHAQAAGGARIAGPIDVPAGRFATASDPAGAVFSVVEAKSFDD